MTISTNDYSRHENDASTIFKIGQSATRVYLEIITHLFKKENESLQKEK